MALVRTHRMIGAASLAAVALLMSACGSSSDTASRSAQAASSAPSVETSAAPSLAASQAAVAEQSMAPSASPSGEPAGSLTKSTRVCFQNQDEVGLWRDWVKWINYDTKTGDQPAYGQSVCAEGKFTSAGEGDGDDVSGTLHLSNADRSNFLDIDFAASNRVFKKPFISISAPGASVDSRGMAEGESFDLWIQSPGNPRRQLHVERRNDTAWKEFVITARSLHACKPGGECAVGDLGPGGGIVVYDAGSQQAWGRYLEVAQAGWAGGDKDPKAVWCPAGSPNLGADFGTGRNIGDGPANTKAAIKGCGTETAAGKAAAYRGGGKDDWFLPSMGEFNQVWSHRSLSNGMVVDNYWTSSQAETDIDKAIKMAIELSNDDWDDTPFFRANMDQSRYVRPMRAF